MINNMLSRGIVLFASAAGMMQKLNVSLLFEESKADVEYFEQYGFTSIPNQGAETLTAFIEGDRSHGVVVASTDRRYRIKTLLSGEVAIYDDIGTSIMLKKTGIAIAGAGNNITITGSPTISITGGNVSVTGGDVIADGIHLKTHKHGGVATGSGQTGVPV